MAGSDSRGEEQFDRILRAEIEAINQRRESLGRPKLDAGGYAGPDGKVLDAVGLSLSGGGIRSAAVSLGVLQAMNHHDLLRKVDYLSTVSGGGYMGCALSATMTCTKGEFVFGGAPSAGSDMPASDVADTPSVGHLRNYSNYLNSDGAYGLLASLAVVMRGIIANLGLVTSIVLLLAAYTIFLFPYRSLLGCPDLMGVNVCYVFWLPTFGTTFLAILFGLIVFYAWAVYRSFVPSRKLVEFQDRFARPTAIYFVVLLVIFLLDVVALLLRGMFDVLGDTQRGVTNLDWFANLTIAIAMLVAPTAIVLAILHGRMGSGRLAVALGNLGTVTAAASVPLLAWVAYLYLAFWGIVNDNADKWLEARRLDPVRWSDYLSPGVYYKCSDLIAKMDARERMLAQRTVDDDGPDYGSHTPEWLMSAASSMTYRLMCPSFSFIAEWTFVPRPAFRRMMDRPLIAFYSIMGLVLLGMTLLLSSNANSLHHLYRGRLSRAFLFDPTKRKPADDDGDVVRPEAERDFASLQGMRVSEISCRFAPYHLINTALNIQGSAYANRRGRNADFFIISPRFIGSAATGYANTHEFEEASDDLDIATAMAISGAAASSNMGTSSIPILRPTLALLNVRLGYWLKNPREIGRAVGARSSRRGAGRGARFLLGEIAGRPHEGGSEVYLTDGGHIENLGIYELLRRRCRLIIAVDAESDPALRFSSFMTLQRYARIDLGIRIDMPTLPIRKSTRVWMGGHGIDDDQLVSSSGPHAAIAQIDYGAGRTGFILYFKSSLTGDESSYVMDYSRRSGLFPHESTGNQFFNEEQFEVYRALGFHIAHGVFSGRDEISISAGEAQSCTLTSDHAGAAAIRDALKA